MKDKNYVIISIDAEKEFDKIQHPFMIKNTQISGDRGTIPQHSKGYICKLAANIILNGQKLKVFLLRSRTR